MSLEMLPDNRRDVICYPPVAEIALNRNSRFRRFEPFFPVIDLDYSGTQTYRFSTIPFPRWLIVCVILEF